MDKEGKFWAVIWIGTLIALLAIIGVGTATHHKNQTRLMECAELKSAVNCQCLIHGYHYCYVPE